MISRNSLVSALIAALLPMARAPVSQAAPRADGQLELQVVDAESGQPLAARIHLKNSRGRSVKLRRPGAAEHADHFYIDGQATLPLRRGQYTFEIEATPDYVYQTGHFEIDRHADDTKRIEMKRFANLAEEGWWAGDLDTHRSPNDMPLIRRAEGLQDIQFPKFARFLTGAPPQSTIRDPQSAIGIARVPYAWHLPLWLARDEAGAIQLIHHHSLRDGVVDDEDDGRPRDPSLFPGRTGNGRWSESVYYHVLNCGLRIPPAAGSGSGTNDNPAGTNRVYVHCGEQFTAEDWWEGLQAGRVFVTNGPLLRPVVEGRPPGHVFHINPGESRTFEVGLNLATRVPIDYLQLIQNGRVAAEVRLDEWKNRKGRLPPLSFDRSGWFLVRAVTTNTKTYQFASSGPYYVEQAGRPLIDRASVQFFLDWLAAAEHEIEPSELQFARRYFETLLHDSTANQP